MFICMKKGKTISSLLKKQKVVIMVTISCGLNRYVNVKSFKPVHKDSVSRWIKVFFFQD